MPYLIDGHNLIPKLPGFSLEEMDDELHLVEWLQPFCRIKRQHVDVFFDGAQPGSSPHRRYGMVTAHFVRQGSTADEAIHLFLAQQKNAARNFTVVSSDYYVTDFAHRMHATVVSSDEFSRELVQIMYSQPAREPDQRKLSEEEIAYWENIFKKKP